MATFYQLDFEKPVVELEQQIETLEGRLKQAPASEMSAEGTPVPGSPTATLANDLAAIRAKHHQICLLYTSRCV